MQINLQIGEFKASPFTLQQHRWVEEDDPRDVLKHIDQRDRWQHVYGKSESRRDHELIIYLILIKISSLLHIYHLHKQSISVLFYKFNSFQTSSVTVSGSISGPLGLFVASSVTITIFIVVPTCWLAAWWTTYTYME